MNALLEFFILSGISFFLFMFIGFKDATRTNAPSGPLAKLFNNVSFWKSEDEKGVRGYLFRQNILFKMLLAIAGAALIRMIYAFFFDFSIPSETFNMFSGLTAFFLHALVILAGIYLSYMWPQVRSKASELTQKVYKDPEEKAKEQAKLDHPPKTEIPPANEQPTPEKPSKQNPDDIINDYLN